MQVYGFDYNNIFFLLSVNTANPVNSGTNTVNLNFNTPYTFNATGINPPFGNPFIPANSANATFSNSFPDWISTTNNEVDLRGFYLKQCNNPAFGNYCMALAYPSDVLTTVSNITHQPVAYTTESIFYAQSSYFVTVVMVQWSNVFACKSRKVSFTFSALNKHMFGGIALETFLFVFFLYVPGVNNVFGGRHLPFFLLGIPGIAFSITLLLWEEARKFLINMDSNNGDLNWWQRNLLW